MLARMPRARAVSVYATTLAQMASVKCAAKNHNGAAIALAKSAIRVTTPMAHLLRVATLNALSARCALDLALAAHFGSLWAVLHLLHLRNLFPLALSAGARARTAICLSSRMISMARAITASSQTVRRHVTATVSALAMRLLTSTILRMQSLLSSPARLPDCRVRPKPRSPSPSASSPAVWFTTSLAR